MAKDNLNLNMTVYNPKPTPGNIDWFTHARFGMFIHWGIYSAAARHEWVKQREEISDEDYQKYFDQFDPDLYDPTSWAKTAKQAGMKYAVITTKHHDGFCLWDSRLTEYKATNTPAGRDLIRPWVEAFRNEGLNIGFYHSLIDWRHSEFPVDPLHPQRNDHAFRKANRDRDIQKYTEYLHGQVREILTDFGTIDILWLDFSYSHFQYEWGRGKGKEDWQSEKLIAMVREINPDIIINNRTEISQDIHTPEQFMPRGWFHYEGEPVNWEACHTLNGSWGYDRDNLDWKSPQLLIKMLIDAVSKGGNTLLNVGPTARGELDQKANSILSTVGEWMHSHSRSIYGCSASQHTPPPDCRYTHNPDTNRLYLHIFDWPLKHLHLPKLKDKIEYAQLLNDGSEVKIIDIAGKTSSSLVDLEAEKRAPNSATLEIPVQKPPADVPVIELFLRD